MPTRRSLLAAGLALPAAPALAQSMPLRFIVPNAPGGTSDILARLLAPEIGRTLGQTVIVENRAGAGGNIGLDLVAKAAPDGNTLVILDVTTIATNPAFFPRLPFRTADLAPVSMVVYAPYILGVAPSLNIADARALEAWAKANPTRINAANSGSGTASHLSLVMLGEGWGVPMTHVPYRGGAPALLATSTGEATMTVAGATQSLPLATDGRMRPVAVTGPRRLPQLPDVPTFRELGWPGPDAGTWQGVLTTAGTPRPRVEALHAALRDAMAVPAVAERIAGLGATVRGDGPEALGAWLAEQTESYGRLIRANNITAE